MFKGAFIYYGGCRQIREGNQTFWGIRMGGPIFSRQVDGGTDFFTIGNPDFYT